MPPPPLMWMLSTGQEQKSLETSHKALESSVKEQDMMVSMSQVLTPTVLSRAASENDGTSPIDGTKVEQQGQAVISSREPNQVMMKNTPSNISCPAKEVKISKLDQPRALGPEKESGPTLSTDEGSPCAPPKKTVLGVLPALTNQGITQQQPSAPPPAVFSQQLSQVLILLSAHFDLLMIYVCYNFLKIYLAESTPWCPSGGPPCRSSCIAFTLWIAPSGEGGRGL